MIFLYIYVGLSFVFYIFMSSRSLWTPSATNYSKTFISFVWPLSIFVILIYIWFMKQEQDSKEVETTN
jgi:hypothetical protein